MDKWFGKVAVVTGASSGIGAAIAQDLARSGVITIGLARRPTKIDELKNDLGEFAKNLYSKECDVSCEESIKSSFKWIAENHGNINILINNAGVGSTKMILEADADSGGNEDIHRVIKTNLFGVIYCTREAFKQMTISNDECYIVNINSICGHEVPFFGENIRPPPGVYAASKYAMTANNEVIRQELNYLKKNNIRITSISPGTVQTSFAESAGYGKIKFPIALEPEDVSGAVLYVLGTPPRVHIKEIIMKPNGELF